MKPFNLEEAKAGKPVCTREGNKVRIICFDCVDECYPIIALVRIRHTERVTHYSKEGKYYCDSNDKDDRDLMMADVIHEGYINIYKRNEEVFSGTTIFETKEKAKTCSCDLHYLDTVKIQWKE